MEEFIYIILGVLWLAASIYRATKKGKKPAGPQSPGKPHAQEDTGVPNARSLIEELLGGQQVEVPEPVSREINFTDDDFQEKEVEPERSFQSEYAAYGLKGLEGMSEKGGNAPGQITFVDEMKEVTQKGSGQKKINLRKAIIYSAILERPYT